MGYETIIRRTASVCPVCLRRLDAVLAEDGATGEIRLKKECPEHGAFSAIVWRGKRDFGKWIGDVLPMKPGENPHCPTGCGLCPDHLRATCCMLLEVTHRCNLNCRFCFADDRATPDPPLSEIAAQLRALAVPGKTLVQLSGGEPTVRDDLPAIVRAAKEAGCRYVQLNSNGVRLAREPQFVRELADAGLSFVFLQFDGVTEDIYETLRGEPLLAVKERAIENCAHCGVGVTLVPTLVPGVNTEQIGDILRFAAERSPAVRGVHFQPVSYFGRIPSPPTDAERFTLDELMEAISVQGKGLVPEGSIGPSCCDHPLCGLHGDFVVLPDRSLYALHAASSSCACDDGQAAADKNRAFVARRWERRAPAEPACRCESAPAETSCRCESAPAEPACCCESAPAEASCCCESVPTETTCCCESAPAEASCCCESAPAETPCCCESAPAEASCCCESVPAEASCCCESAPAEPACCCESAPPDGVEADMSNLDYFVRRTREYGFTVTAMAFQDAGTLDIERLRRCSLHVYRDGRVVPFCANYLTAWGK